MMCDCGGGGNVRVTIAHDLNENKLNGSAVLAAASPINPNECHTTQNGRPKASLSRNSSIFCHAIKN